MKYKATLTRSAVANTIGETSLEEKTVSNSHLYRMVEDLTDQAQPKRFGKGDLRWISFYLPVRDMGRAICVPFAVTKYRDNFYVHLNVLGRFCVTKGDDEYDKLFDTIVSEVAKFVPDLRDRHDVERLVPYECRTGKIKGRYVLERKLLPARLRRKILSAYKAHLAKRLTTAPVSLNQFLNVTAICYRAVHSEADSMQPQEMYERWADVRHGGMLELKNPNSVEEYGEWLHGRTWEGSHPFEIFPGYSQLGIHLMPPKRLEEIPWNPDMANVYVLSLSATSHAETYVKAANALMEHNISFIAPNLAEMLQYLAGESMFTVNSYSGNKLLYSDTREEKRKYFKHIEWDGLKIVKLVKTKNQTPAGNEVSLKSKLRRGYISGAKEARKLNREWEHADANLFEGGN